jgi:hypothetical protein
LDGGNADAQVTKLGSKILSIILIGALWIILITLSHPYFLLAPIARHTETARTRAGVELDAAVLRVGAPPR